jgi:hypothetical protein
MKNHLSDLNNILFETLETLNDRDINGDALREEIERAKAMVGIAGTIIKSGALALQAQIVIDNRKDNDLKLPNFLVGD